ncbi:MAG: hypothetical protein M1492_11095 [Gammaproteobacteria bacterium]|jgi:hypothetical protein|nr:hypothetical protein [Gammaproteobacteria bacterium]
MSVNEALKNHPMGGRSMIFRWLPVSTASPGDTMAAVIVYLSGTMGGRCQFQLIGQSSRSTSKSFCALWQENDHVCYGTRVE